MPAAPIRVRQTVLDAMLEHARREPSIECCGLLAGRDAQITQMFAADNLLASASEYEIAPAQLFQFFRAMRAEGLTHMGIYHSHPRGPNLPSPRDVERAWYPEAAYFIVSPATHVTRPIRAFSIREGRFTELQVTSI